MAVTPLTNAQMEARFGYAMAFFNSDSELKTLAAKAKKQAWDATNFQAALRNTRWYKNRTASQRQFDEAHFKDPSTYTDNINDQRSLITKQAAALGIDTGSPAFVAWRDGTPAKGKTKAVLGAAYQNVRNAASDSEVQTQLASYWYRTYYGAGAKGNEMRPDVNIDNMTLQGQSATTASQLRTMAAQYGYPAGNDWLEQNIYKVLSGTQNVSDTAEQMKKWAASQYVGVADRINNGETLEQILDPYKQVAADVLGDDKSGMKTTDTKWLASIDNEAKVPMSLDEWKKKIRTDSQYGYDTSTNAKQDAFQMASSLRSIFQGD
ncbi:MAG: hypothetical protein ACOYB3_01715 [Azonexus sp.]